MKTFNITVNGTAYNVTVEETAGGAAAALRAGDVPASPKGSGRERPSKSALVLTPRAPFTRSRLSAMPGSGVIRSPIPSQSAAPPARQNGTSAPVRAAMAKSSASESAP